jgi:hypothetical protein
MAKVKAFPKNLKHTAHLKKPTKGKAKMLLKYSPDYMVKVKQ